MLRHVTTALNNKGRVVIPASVCQKYEFRTGDKLLIEQRIDGIALRKAQRRRKKSLVQWMLDCPVQDFNPWK
jgi:AbrB family looped-hinge helix DNA binding protein